MRAGDGKLALSLITKAVLTVASKELNQKKPINHLTLRTDMNKIFAPVLAALMMATAYQPVYAADTVPDKFANDDEMLDFVQKAHLNYMWEGADPTSGLAYERIHLDNNYPENDRTVITTGGSGFGIAGLLVGMERGWIPRKEGVERLQKIVDYLGKADRYHGVWSHWMEGPTGKTKPFGKKDNGGDLVESSFRMASLLMAREYLKNGDEQEKKVAAGIDKLWREMDYQWYTKGGEDVLYWHWSPDYAWEMNFPLEGYNECLIFAHAPCFARYISQGLDPQRYLRYRSGHLRSAP